MLSIELNGELEKMIRKVAKLEQLKPEEVIFGAMQLLLFDKVNSKDYNKINFLLKTDCIERKQDA